MSIQVASVTAAGVECNGRHGECPRMTPRHHRRGCADGETPVFEGCARLARNVGGAAGPKCPTRGRSLRGGAPLTPVRSRRSTATDTVDDACRQADAPGNVDRGAHDTP